MEKEDLIGSFESKRWGTVKMWRDAYLHDDTLAVTLTTIGGEPLATLSVHLDTSAELPENCFYVKAWSENREIADEAWASGLFKRRTDIPAGHTGLVTAEVWEIAA